jgi:hypothetical protein
MALGRFLQEVPLGLVKPFSPPGHGFLFVSGFFFLLHKKLPRLLVTVFAGYAD